MTDELATPKQNVENRLKSIENILNEYTSKVGTSSLKYNNEVESLLEMTAEDFRGLTAEQCGEKAFVLYRYAAYLQKESNRNSVRVIWAEKSIGHEMGKKCRSYGNQYTSYEERKAMAMSDETDAYLQALINLRFHAKSRLEELSFLPGKIAMMADTLMQTQKSKNNERWANK